ncbi:MAG TPA: hypothetical protein VH115_01180, partial [Solirubrobacteraceae bacterium]|nr:hypothetical protein [Solirubrobacteraceae bacterium]
MILCAFAVAIGSLTVHRIRNDFNKEVADTANQLPSQLKITFNPVNGAFAFAPLQYLASGDHAVIRIMSIAGAVEEQYPANAPAFGFLAPGTTVTVHGYRVVNK